MNEFTHKSTFILDSPPGNLPLVKPGHTDFKTFMQVLTDTVFNGDILTPCFYYFKIS
jgi:hypothetical protein